MNTLGVYIQIPFCSSKCTFCNFSSSVAPTGVLKVYLQALEREIDLPSAACESNNRGRQGVASPLALPVDSVYLGGGTPTLAGTEGLNRLFSSLRRRFKLESAPEITIEMTPGSADVELLASCRDLGINRLSIGAQSFEDRELRSVGRLHSQAETAGQIRLAREAGFRNVGLDLIAGLPYQTESSWLANLRRTIDLAPEHVSIYLFEIDEKSRLGNEVLQQGERCHAASVPNEEFVAEAYEQARDLLGRAGYAQYEISNFSRPGFQSRHNRKYWTRQPYLGLGAGAHSFDGLARWSNEVSLAQYAGKLAQGDLPVSDFHILDRTEQIEEFFFLGLRQQEGVDLQHASARWGVAALEKWQPRIDSLVERGLLQYHGPHLCLNRQAYVVSNEVFQEFVM